MTEVNSIDVDGFLEPDRLIAQRGRLQAIARALLGDEQAAEDVVSDTMLRALRTPPSEPTALSAWLTTAVKRLALNRRRERVHRTEREQVSASPESAPPVDEAVARVEIQRQVIDRVLQLREPYRTAIVLRYFEELSPPTIAARLRIPEKTVKSQLHRGLAILRGNLDRECEGGRRAWCAALLPVAGMGKHAPLGVSAGFSSLAAVGGVWIMSRTLLVAIGLLLVTAITAGVFVWGPGPMEPEPVGVAAAPGVVEDQEDIGGPATTVVRAPFEEESGLKNEAPRVDPNDPNGALQIRVVFEGGGDPEVVGIVLQGKSDDSKVSQILETDAAGVVLVGSLVPGAYEISALRGGSVDGVVRAGEATSVELILPRAMDVHGEVVDGDGNPVSNASIWLVKDTSWVGGRVETTSDEKGHFRLRSVDSGRAIAAFADGFMPSAGHSVGWGATSGDDVDLRLVLDHPAGTLRGRVIDEWDRPVQGARVAIWGGPDGSTSVIQLERPNILLSTDSAGMFATTSARIPYVLVAVEAEGFAPYHTGPDTGPGTEDLVIRLGTGVTIEGVVRDERGQAVPNAIVTASSKSVLMFGSRSVSSGVDGHYSMPLLPRIRLDVTARSGVATAETLVVGKRGVTRWDPILSSGGVIRGRVVDDAGTGLGGLKVCATTQYAGADVGEAITVDDGSFMIGGIDVPGCFLWVNDPENKYPIAFCSWVRPGGPPVVLRVQEEARPSAYISGTLQDDAGVALNGTVSLMASQLDWDTTLPSGLRRGAGGEVVDGRFRLGPMRPGRWTVHAMLLPGGEFLTYSDPIELKAREEVEIVLCTEPAGSVAVHIDGAETLDRRWLHLNISDPVRGEGRGILEESGRFVADGMAPGEYVIRVSARGYVDAKIPVVIRSGEVTPAHVQLEPGVDVTITMAPPKDAPWWKVTEVRVRDSSGAPRIERSIPFYPNNDHVTASGKLPLGRYTIEAWTDSGLRAAGEVVVDSLEERIEVELTLDR